MTALLQLARKFWYNNEQGAFPVQIPGQQTTHHVTRPDIQRYGGPSREFEGCPLCQVLEWTSRIQQKDRFVAHNCPSAKRAKWLCERQGDELWTHYHQDFSFSLGCDPDLHAPRGVCLFAHEPVAQLGRRFKERTCEQWMINLRRQLAQACQIDVIGNAEQVKDWTRYDFLFFQNTGNVYFKRPPIPIIMYGHDLHGRTEAYQRTIDHFQPDVFLTPYPTAWQNEYRFPRRTKIEFYPLSSSNFFTRPNLEGPKPIDLLVIGSITPKDLYPERNELNRQLAQIENQVNVVHSHHRGCLRHTHNGLVQFERNGHTIRYLNKWSEYLGTAKFVIFGPSNYRSLHFKYFEAMGSGAIPIMPWVPDMVRLGIQEREHFIPLHEVWNSGQRLLARIEHWDNYKYLAQNAVAWHKENGDRVLFDRFEDVIQDVTDHRYERRLVQ